MEGRGTRGKRGEGKRGRRDSDGRARGRFFFFLYVGEFHPEWPPSKERKKTLEIFFPRWKR